MKRSKNDFTIVIKTEEDETTNKKYMKDKLDIVLEKLSNLEDKIDNNTHLLTGLTDEIIAIKNGLRTLINESESENLNILPDTPFDDLEKFLEFDSNIKEPAKYKILTNNLSSITANSHKEFVFKCWRALLKDSLAKNLCWSGTKQKISIQELSCTSAIKDAFIKKYPAESIDAYAEKTKKFFLYANDRLNKLEKYKTKPK